MNYRRALCEIAWGRATRLARSSLVGTSRVIILRFVVWFVACDRVTIALAIELETEFRRAFSCVALARLLEPDLERGCRGVVGEESRRSRLGGG
jgi:hypothetical protein